MRSRTDFIVVHSSATRLEMDVDVEVIRGWHRRKGYSDIGYHYVILPSGVVQPGRPENAVGAHVQGYNARSIGICLVGGLDGNNEPTDNYTGLQKAALWRLIDELEDRYPEATVLGHRDLSPDRDGDGVVERHEWLKACPCFDVRAERAKRTLRASVG